MSSCAPGVELHQKRGVTDIVRTAVFIRVMCTTLRAGAIPGAFERQKAVPSRLRCERRCWRRHSKGRWRKLHARRHSRGREGRAVCTNAQTHEHGSDDGVGNGAGGGGVGDGGGGGRGDGLRMREPMHHSSEGQQEREGHAHTALDGMQGSASSMGERIPFPTRMPKRKSPKAKHLGESNPSSLEHCPRLGHQSGPGM